MANPQVATAFLTFSVTATSAASDYPASNLLLPHKWQRTWRSVGIGLTRVTLDFGATTAAAAVYYNAANMASIAAHGSDNLSDWTSCGSAGPALDARVRRRHGILLLTAFSFRYLRLTFDQPQSSYYELGAVVVASALTTLSNGFGVPLTWTVREAATRLEYVGGGGESQIEGACYLEYQLQGAPWRQTAMTELLGVFAAAKSGRILVFENRGDAAHAYLVERPEDLTVGEAFRTFDAAVRLVEAM